MIKRKWILATFMVVGMILGGFLATTASATQYTQVVPGGLSMSSTTATARVQQLLNTDAGVREAIASNYSGLTAEELDGARVVSTARTSVVLGRTEENSARDVRTGNIVPTSYMRGKRVTAWRVTIRIRAGKTVVQNFKHDCSNPLLRKGQRKPALRITRNVKAFAVKFAKSKTTKRVDVCPSGQSVTVTVKTNVRGRVKVKSITQAAKLQSQRLSAQVTLDVTNQISVVCAQQPSVVSSPPPPVVVQQIICGNGSQQIGDGNSSAIVGDHCNTVTPPPPPPPPPAVPAPIAETPGLAHTYVNGNATLFIKVKPALGKDVTVQAVSSIGNVSGVQSSDTYANEACQSGWKCYRAQFWAPSTPGQATVTFTVRQDDGQETSVFTVVNIVADEF